MVSQHTLQTLVKPHPRRRIPWQHRLGGVAPTNPLPPAKPDNFSSRLLHEGTEKKKTKLFYEDENRRGFGGQLANINVTQAKTNSYETG